MRSRRKVLCRKARKVKHMSEEKPIVEQQQKKKGRLFGDPYIEVE